MMLFHADQKYKSYCTEDDDEQRSVEDNGAQLIVMLIGRPVNHVHHLHLQQHQVKQWCQAFSLSW